MTTTWGYLDHSYYLYYGEIRNHHRVESKSTMKTICLNFYTYRRKRGIVIINFTLFVRFQFVFFTSSKEG